MASVDTSNRSRPPCGSTWKRIVFVNDFDTHSGASVASLALSPFLDDSGELVVSRTVSPPKKPCVDISHFLDRTKKEIIKDRESRSQPTQYFYSSVSPSLSEVSKRFDRIRVGGDQKLHGDDLIVSVLDSQVNHLGLCCQSMSGILALTEKCGTTGTILILGDQLVQTATSGILEKWCPSHPWKILFVWVDRFAPPSLEYALTTVVIEDMHGLKGELPLVCAGVATGILRNVPFSASCHASFVPLDIAINAGLLGVHRFLDNKLPLWRSDCLRCRCMRVAAPLRDAVAWNTVSQSVVNYYQVFQSGIRSSFPQAELLTRNPSLNFPASLQDTIQWRGGNSTSIQPVDQFLSSQRQKELLFQSLEGVNHQKVEELVAAVENLYPSSTLGINSLTSSVAPQFSHKSQTMSLTNDNSPQQVYSWLVHDIVTVHDRIKLLPFFTLSFVDWSMYFQVVARAVLSHLAQFCTTASNNSVFFPLPTREFMNFRAFKESSCPAITRLKGTTAFFLRAGLLENGRNYRLEPGITPERISTILVQPDVQRIISTASLEEGVSVDVVRKRATDILRRIGDTLNDRHSRFLGTVVYDFFSRVYDKVQINEGGHECLRVITKLPRVQVVLVALHRSYVDFMIMSLLFGAMSLALPHVVSGEDFMRLGPVTEMMRGTGAFFMKRSFRGDQLYTVLFKEYIRQLVLHTQLIEFFIEGARSRTGRSSKPKMGILKFVVDAFFKNQNDVSDVLFVPISLSYDQLLEGPVYAKELLGVPKPKETVLNLLKGVTSMKQEYGSINIHIGEPISVQAVKKEQESSNTLLSEKSPQEVVQRAFLSSLSAKLMDQMIQNVVITSTSLVAAVIECTEAQNISLDELLEGVWFLKEWIKKRGGKTTDEVLNLEPEQIAVIGLKHLEGQVQQHHTPRTLIKFKAPEEISRMVVHMSTSQLVHLFVDEGLISVVAYAFGIPSRTSSLRLVKREVMMNNTDILRRVLAHEFVLREDPQWYDRAIARIVGNHEELPLSFHATQESSTVNVAIPVTKLFYFSARLVFPQIDAVYAVVLGLKTLFTAFPQTHLPKRKACSAVHDALVKSYKQERIPFVVSCALDPLRHHFDGLVDLQIITVSVRDGVIVCAPKDKDALQRLAILEEQLNRLRWKDASDGNAEVENLSKMVLVSYNNSNMKHKL